jgi:hypothetical protein
LHELRERDTARAQPEWIHLDVILLRLSAERHDVGDAGHLLELPDQDPVGGRLQLLDRVPAPAHVEPVHLADGIPRRELRLETLRQLDELEAVDDLLASVLVTRPPLEVALHVSERVERLRAYVIEAGHAGEADLERYRDVALHLLRAPPRRLDDHLHERRHGVGIRLDG